MLPFNAVTLNK